MGEQRFTIQKASGMYLHLPIFDNDVEMADGDVCILLNEQQSTISALKEENDILKQKLRKNYIANKQYEEMKRLQQENEQLRAINKKIGDDLYNCRLNKNIISERLKMWQDAHKKYDIYNIKDFEELMKNDK